jgi:hypothetical protein
MRQNFYCLFCLYLPPRPNDYDLSMFQKKSKKHSAAPPDHFAGAGKAIEIKVFQVFKRFFTQDGQLGFAHGKPPI